MAKISYLIGDATDPKEIAGIKIIAHICNNRGAWGAGFVLALSNRWSGPEGLYRKRYKERGLALGEVQLIQVESDIFVANMIAQELGYTQDKNGRFIPPIRYEALKECLIFVSMVADAMGASVVAPRFGAGLAGGDWNEVENVINIAFHGIDVPIYIFDLPIENKKQTRKYPAQPT